MLEKSMYDSWASRIRLFIIGKKHGRMMLDSIDNGPLVYPTIEEDGQTRPKKYSKVTEAQQLQDDCDVQATNIILHGLPPDVYALVNHQEAAKDIWDKLINGMHTIGMTMQQVQVITKFLNSLPLEWSKFVTDVKLPKSLYTTNYDQLLPFKMEESQFNKFKEDQLRVLLVLETKELLQLQGTTAWFKENLMLTEAQEADCDDLTSAKAVLMANLSSCDSNVLSEVQYSDTYPNDIINQDVQEMSYSEQTHIDDF
ncbi:hypothetical protein Tco_1281070, partial [Tanacetum coccineum]